MSEKTEELDNKRVGSNPASANEQNDDVAIQALNELEKIKKESVPRSQYEDLLKREKSLVDKIIQGNPIEVKVEQPKEEGQDKSSNKKTDDELRQDIFGGNSSNRQYWESMLELRRREIAKGKPDPFVTHGFDKDGREIKPDYSEKLGTEEMVKNIQECLDIADGDDQVFINEMSRRER